ncbi:MAG: dockerin type I repeat-containing protein [Armatimonadota bacterium]
MPKLDFALRTLGIGLAFQCPCCAYQTVKGDFIAYIKIVSIPTYEEMGDWSKHGLMVRLNDTPGSPHFTVLAGTGRRTINEYRMEQDGLTTSGLQPNESYRPGQWLKLVRKGGTLCAFWSYSDTGDPFSAALPLEVHIPAFEGQDEVLLAVADTTGLSTVGTPAYASYSTFRVVPYDEAMTATLPPPPPAVLPGDVNGDGKVGIPDATLALQIAVGILKAPSPAQLASADINKTGGWTYQT